MKILRSSLLRAVCAIIVGVLLIQYPGGTVTWITVAIGVLFLLSGVISCATYLNAARNASTYKITDAEGRVISGGKPPLPIVGVGSVVFGALLAIKPDMFVAGLMYVLGAILILGALNQFMALLAARRLWARGFCLLGVPFVGAPCGALRHNQANGERCAAVGNTWLVQPALWCDGDNKLVEDLFVEETGGEVGQQRPHRPVMTRRPPRHGAFSAMPWRLTR